MQHLGLRPASAIRGARRVSAQEALAEAPGRVVLLLQGPASGFWSELGRAFDRAGFRVIRVNLSLGDWLYWTGSGTTINYRGSLGAWDGWLERLVEREGIGDILYYGDRLPYHVAAQRLAARRPGLRAWVVELGYLRPDWLTLEPMAMARRSRFPRCPQEIRRLAADQAAPCLKPRYGHPFAREAAGEVVFNLAHVFGRVAFPRYVSDKPIWPLAEYLAWLPRMATLPLVRRQARREERAHLDGRAPFAVVALQLDTDYQIRASSDYASQREMLAEVISSFARAAPPAMRLLVKLHPDDPGIVNWWRVVRRLGRRHAVESRVTVIRGGNLTRLIRGARGVVTINSTSGVRALVEMRPVKVLGDAVYDVPGMTHRGPLDDFWTVPEEPDASLVDAWTRAAAAEIQVRGSLFNREGQRDGAAEIVRRVGEHRRYWRLRREVAVE